MRIARYDDERIGVVVGRGVVDVSSVVAERWRGTPHAMNDVIARWDDVAPQARDLAASAPPVPLDTVRLHAPTPMPRHLFAAPLNYRPHVAEMVDSQHAPVELRAHHSADSLGFFLKAPGSISGPQDAIELPPLPGRAFHHEIELGVVIGRPARAVAVERAGDHIFGYVCLLDITMRTEGEHQEERVMRKSYETFTPIGPFLVTADEVDDPGTLDLHLEVNGEPRQAANTADLIVSVAELVSRASHVLTLSPGDVYATGTPDGVGPIVVGDTITAGVESIGELEIPVVERSW
jgi:2-keto-4-pentenoate hydratase/2-oxohepta-3-ene-1,7-dioic acid hydratase in catechol pathway